jgi:D-sedoheptulose 7-phosphate isomerase
VLLITAWSNDTAYEHILEEQLANMIEPGDVEIGMSASGNSANVINALRLAKHTRASTVGLLGANGGLIKRSSMLTSWPLARLSSKKKTRI